jgi:hypothetical protein
MKAQRITLAVILLFATSSGFGVPHSQAQASPNCAIAQRALETYANIKIGRTRSEVEKYIVRDGGAQFPSHTRYVYPKCNYIHLDVDFAATGTAGHLFSPDDKVTKVSRLYLDYPSRD